jgi:ketosteroid isomerase-like protein
VRHPVYLGALLIWSGLSLCFLSYVVAAITALYVDLGDRVFVLFHDFACLEGTTEELNQTPANIWTVRDGEIARAEFYIDWSDALKALGLTE